MPTRSILLRILFGSLAAAAFFGAVGILFSSNQGLWRIAGTSIATAAAALLLLPAGIFLEKPQTRSAANAAITLIVGEFLLALLAIWAPDRWDTQWRFWGTFGMGLACGIPSIAFVRMLAPRWTRIAGIAGLVIAAAVFSLVTLEIWTDWRWRQSVGFEPADLGGLLVPFGLLMVLCLVGIGSDRNYWRLIGVVAALIAYAIVAYADIHHLHGDPGAVVYITALAAVIAHANVLLLVPLRPGQTWLRWATIAAGVTTAGLTCMVTYVRGSNWGQGDDLLQRAAGACGVIAGCGTLAMIVLARINRRYLDVTATPLSELREITLTCPLCRKKQTIPLNAPARCGGCNVQIQVKVEEPRCAVCGYSLMMLTSGVCPECGTPVPAQSSLSLSPSTASADATAQTFPLPPVQTAHTP